MLDLETLTASRRCIVHWLVNGSFDVMSSSSGVLISPWPDQEGN